MSDVVPMVSMMFTEEMFDELEELIKWADLADFMVDPQLIGLIKAARFGLDAAKDSIAADAE